MPKPRASTEAVCWKVDHRRCAGTGGGDVGFELGSGARGDVAVAEDGRVGEIGGVQHRGAEPLVEVEQVAGPDVGAVAAVHCSGP